MIQKARLDKRAIQNYGLPQFYILSAFLKQIGFAKTQELVAIAALAFVCELDACFNPDDENNTQKQRA